VDERNEGKTVVIWRKARRGWNKVDERKEESKIVIQKKARQRWNRLDERNKGWNVGTGRIKLMRGKRAGM